ncbi:MAG: hypothetical protein E7378_04730, partial [Clostridiales bacterium]|nr:hypothetical protein [Clostridiales bacterium]
MLDKKEKFVILYLLEICPQKRPYLIFAEQIAEFVSKKYLISTSELDDIMLSLAKDNYVDFVVSDSKKGYYYCITLKSKALTLKNDLKKQKKEFAMVLLKTFGLAVFSFIVGIILKTIKL